MTVASQRQQPLSSPRAICVFVEDLLRTRSRCRPRFNWSQMLAVVRLSTSLQKWELLNQAQFAGDTNWQVETRITPRLTEGSSLAGKSRANRVRLFRRSRPRDRWPHKLDKAAMPPPASKAAPASRPARRGSGRGRSPGTHQGRGRGESPDMRVSRDRIQAAP